MRSILGAVFPLFATEMFNGMGIQWACTLLGCVAVVLIPVPVWFLLRGGKIREKSKFAPTHLMKQMEQQNSQQEKEEV